MRAGIILSVVLAAGVAAGCGGSAAGGSRETIVAAFYPLAYAAQRLAPGADVRNLTPAGAEPHDLELSARDVERVRDADLVVYLGGGFMPAVEQAVDGRDNAVDVLPAEGRADPHVWLDPERYAAIVRRIAVAVGRPRAAKPLTGELDRLDRDFRTGLADCARRDVVTSHAAFGYLTRAYGLRQVPLTGISPEAEPSAKAIERLVAEVGQTGATTVFTERLVSPTLADAVAREAGVRTAVLDPLEGLTQHEEETGADYFSVMRANLRALRKALACT